MTHSALLGKGGFKRIGCWSAPTGLDEIALEAAAPPNPGVYAHVVDGVVHYVGSAQRGVHGRMRHYARTKSMRTAYRIRQLILEALGEGRTVELYVMVPDATELSYKGLPVDVISGVEEGLIRHLRPTWNKRGLGPLQ